MPIYEYKCDVCGHEFEKLLHFSERDVPLNTPCPNRILDSYQDPQCFDCDGKVHLKMSLGSFHLKGSGWYKDGYGKGKQESKKGEPVVKPTEKKPVEAKPLADSE